MDIVYPSYWDGNVNHYGDVDHKRFTISDPPRTLCGLDTRSLNKQPVDQSPLSWYDCAVCKARAIQLAAASGANDGAGERAT
jgi:hypothetical protein